MPSLSQSVSLRYFLSCPRPKIKPLNRLNLSY